MENDIVEVLRSICDHTYDESVSLEAIDAMEAAIEEIKKLRAENDRLKSENERLRNEEDKE